MLKTILLGSALVLAMPAFAQSPASHGPVNTGSVGTTGHDPLQTADDATVQTNATPSTDVQARGDVSGTSLGQRASLAAPTGTCLRNGRPGRMSKACSTPNTGMTGNVGMTGNAGMTGTASAAAGAGWTGGASASSYTGMGGPDTGTRSYPVCSRTVTDNCTQTGRQRRHR
ncbi:MAG: hypothetical protein QOH81_710 [Sphingomonadales bacterium]|jgi:hypothetical protein|nr:hypothetical protein [Sphingomonadales bacterium]